MNSCCDGISFVVPAGANGSGLPVCGGRLPAHQLFQLQLLVLCGSICGRPHLPAHHAARQTQACEGASFSSFLTVCVGNRNSVGSLQCLVISYQQDKYGLDTLKPAQKSLRAVKNNKRNKIKLQNSKRNVKDKNCKYIHIKIYVDQYLR